MGFVLASLGMVLFMAGVLVVVGHFYPGSSADLVDWKPTRSPQVEAENEIADIQQMLEAQNEMRRRRGAREIDEAELRAEVEREELEQLRRRNPFGD
ncbi:MAG TPA: hypothetical protein VFI63_04410 [Solirubrobacterales bacterium]|nr:hypothetical protein [Solirubrobacterales bacterium]